MFCRLHKVITPRMQGSQITLFRNLSFKFQYFFRYTETLKLRWNFSDEMRINFLPTVLTNAWTFCFIACETYISPEWLLSTPTIYLGSTVCAVSCVNICNEVSPMSWFKLLPFVHVNNIRILIVNHQQAYGLKNFGTLFTRKQWQQDLCSHNGLPDYFPPG